MLAFFYVSRRMWLPIMREMDRVQGVHFFLDRAIERGGRHAGFVHDTSTSSQHIF